MIQETLDRRDADPATVRATLRDLAVTNRWFGGRQAVAYGLRRVLGDRSGRVTVLDIGAGGGDIARYLTDRFAPDVSLTVMALDHLVQAAQLARDAGTMGVVADLAALPLGTASVDVVILSQVLHHLDRTAAPALLRSCASLARIGIVVADLRRSPIARLGIGAAAHALRFHPVTREDGMLSVRRGFTRQELGALCAAAGLSARVRRRPGWRLVAWWRR